MTVVGIAYWEAVSAQLVFGGQAQGQGFCKVVVDGAVLRK